MISWTFTILLLASKTVHVRSDAVSLPFTDCFSGNASNLVDIQSVYGQVTGDSGGTHWLKLVALGSSPNGIQGYSNESNAALSTLFTTTDVLTLSVFETSAYLCSTLNPSPLYTPSNNSNNDPSTSPRYCPLPSGPFAFSSSIPLGGTTRALTTLTTRLKALDPFAQEMFCVDVQTTPIDADLQNQEGEMGKGDAHYGQAIYIFYISIALALAYFLISALARLSSAWGRGLSHPNSPHKWSMWSRMQSAGYIIASAISGERLNSSPSLLRFCTPSVKDVVLHTQFCAIIGMIRVEWGEFVYPLLTQTSWATLAWNITVSPTSPRHYTPVSPPFLAPSLQSFPQSFSDQLQDQNQPLYLNTSTPNILLAFPRNNTNDGIEKFAFTLGIRPQDLFPLCLTVFLGAVAATIVVSLVIWLIDAVISSLFGSAAAARATRTRRDSMNALGAPGTRSPLPFSGTTGSKDGLDGTGAASPTVMSQRGGSVDGHTSLNLFRPPSKMTLTGLGGERSGTPGPSRGIGQRRWYKRFLPRDTGLSSFHFSVLHGNLVRLLVLFHLPITVFSSYSMVLPVYSSNADQYDIATSRTLKGLASVSFVFLSILIPAHLILRIIGTPTNKLFSETRTLLSLGPLYNLYRQGSQSFAILYFVCNIIIGTTIGASQGSKPSTASSVGDAGGMGLAQAIVLLICQIAEALVTSIWLPWGFGAGMGLWSFLGCVGRIVVAVLIIILSPTISVGPGPASWVTYGVLVLLALTYLALTLIFFIKVIEAIIRLIMRQPFRNSTSSSDAGLLGACYGNRRRRSRRRRGKGKNNGHRYTKTSESMSHHLQSPTPTSSFLPPKPLGGKGGSSMHSGPPPSVLKPDQALKGYDSDEDIVQQHDTGAGGFIMGAWKPEGYEAVPNPNAPQEPPKKSSGFSRVGGGRAKMDNPYDSIPGTSAAAAAAAAGAATTFPRGGSVSPAKTPDGPRGQSPIPMSTISADLPPGAATPHRQQQQPAHVRTKSQTAIIENYAAQQAAAQPTSNLAMNAEVFSSDEEDDEEENNKGKRKWFHLIPRKGRASTGGINSPPTTAGLKEGGGGHRQSWSLGERGFGGGESSGNVDSGAAGGEGTQTPPRSFVVIRKGQQAPGSSSSGAR